MCSLHFLRSKRLSELEAEAMLHLDEVFSAEIYARKAVVVGRRQRGKEVAKPWVSRGVSFGTFLSLLKEKCEHSRVNPSGICLRKCHRTSPLSVCPLDSHLFLPPLCRLRRHLSPLGRVLPFTQGRLWCGDSQGAPQKSCHCCIYSREMLKYGVN